MIDTIQNIPENWEMKSLGDVINLISGGTPKTSVAEYWGGDINWLSVVDFNNDGRYVSKTEKTITQLGLEKSSTRILNKGDLIISARGTVGALAQLTKEMAFNQSCYGIRGKDNISDNVFLYYLIMNEINSLRKISHGGVFETITRQTFNNIFCQLPQLPEQQHIAGVLSALDDKIANNRKINETLENMAQAMFKAWFTDFTPTKELIKFKNGTSQYKTKHEIAKALYMPPETLDHFPNNFDNNGLPMGWEYKNLGDTKYAKIISSGINDFTNQKIYLATADVDNTNIVNQETQIAYNERPSRANMQPVNYSIWFAKMKDTRKLLMFAENCDTESHILSTGFAGIKTTEITHYYLWCFIQSKYFETMKNNLANGAVQISVNNTAIKKIDFIMPTENILCKFNETVRPFFDQIKKNNQETQTLTEIRKTLLPKLISGEIRV